MLKSYKIRDIEINNGLVLAPMSGVTSRPFRRLIKLYNQEHLGLVITEFISVEALTRNVQKSIEMMRFTEAERPFAIQIFGYDIERMVTAAHMVEQSGADIIDINCGCPAPKVVRKGGGCNLMREPNHLKEMIKAVRKAVSMPLTIKIRSGWDEKTKNALEIAKIAEGEGVEALAVHGRTRAQLYRGDADWNLVADVANSLKIPVLGSGDVCDRKSAEERLKYGIAGIFVGRGALANPLIFKDIATNSKTDIKSSPSMAIEIVEKYKSLLQEDFHDVACVGKIKQLSSQMCRGFPWRKEILVAKNLPEIEQVIIKVKESINSNQTQLAA
ncbi:MAG: tRNA-dihydrouridine synthase family protein [bacterium]|nr:tRNA-dihydrouridine synthase family protein [bacterium]